MEWRKRKKGEEKLNRRELLRILEEVVEENRRLRGGRSEQASPDRDLPGDGGFACI